MPQKAPKPICGMCGGELVPGVQHICPNVQQQKSQSPDWLKWAAFILQFLVLFGTLMWKASTIQNDIQYMKAQQEKDEKSLENIQRYFQRPLPSYEDNGGGR